MSIRVLPALVMIVVAPHATAQEVQPPDPARWVRVDGTIVVDSDGVRTLPRHGTVDYWLSYFTSARYSSVIQDGRFEMYVSRSDVSLSFGRIVLDGREAYCDLEFFGRPADDKLALNAKWLPEATLRVFEAGGARELTDLEVCQAAGYNPDPIDECNQFHDDGFETSLSSPLRLVPHRYATDIIRWHSDLRWWVRAPGYEWNYAVVEHSLGGQYRLELKGSEKLTVRISGVQPAESVELRIARLGEQDEAQHVSTVHHSMECVRVGELPPGTHVARTTIHTADGDLEGPCALVEVQSGRMAQLDLDVGARAALPRIEPVPTPAVALAVQLEIPRAWAQEGVSLRSRFWRARGGKLTGELARAECALARLDSSPERWSGSVTLAPGPWILRVDGIPWGHAFDVQPSGGSVSAVVLPVVDLRIIVENAESAATIEGTELHWDWAATTDGHFFASQSGLPVPGNDARHLRVPEGAVAIHARKRGFLPKSTLVNALPDAEPVELSLEPSCGIRLHIVNDGVQVRVPLSVPMNVREIHGDSRLVARSSDGWLQEIEVSEPGSYEISPGPIAGYPNAQPLCVDVVRGKFTKARLELQR